MSVSVATATQRLDPITLEVIRNALPAISDEMSADLQRASYNMMIYEVRDYCCALVAPSGALVSQNVGGVSHFVADLGVIVDDCVRRYGIDGISEGDVFITNHQAVAGQHLNNVVVYMPVFVRGQIVCFSMVRAHWIDIGGLSTGFGASTMVGDPWMEGLQIDQLKIVEAGTPNQTLFSIIRSNIRYPDASLGDMRSQIAACQLGSRRLREIYEKYGTDVVEQAIEKIFQASEERCRNIVSAIPDGVYEASSYLDGSRGEPDPIDLRVRVVVDGSEMTIDLSGCSAQRKEALNSRTRAGAMVAYKAITTPDEPVNEGSFGAVHVVIPEGNIMMATFPAPMAGWSQIVPTVVDTIFRALAPAMPDRIPAAHLGELGGAVVFFGTDPRTGQRFVVQSIEGGGWGGRPHEDGASASVSVCQGDVRNAPIETIELRCPVIIEERRLRTDSGGAGRFRGGLGVDTTVRALVPGRWNLAQPRRRGCPPWGLGAGAQPGLIGDRFIYNEQTGEFDSVDVQRHEVPAGTRVRVSTAGGGGWGSPLEREPERVLRDVRENLVSIEAAERDYGVIVNRETLDVDAGATAARRRALAEREPAEREPAERAPAGREPAGREPEVASS